MGQQGQHGSGSVGDQFYVTHCATADSVLNNPGYTVRAASTKDADALDAAFRYPPYELPIDMWKDLPAVADAPRRLARTPAPDDGVWAVHSAYLAKDTVGRDRSYFSHLMLFPTVDPAAVLRSWGANGWATSYAPGSPKKLDGNACVPVGTLVSDASLTAFLSEDPPGPTELSLTVCPIRLRASSTERRDLFARALQAVLLLAAEEDEKRHRLFIHAEPGLVALLLYGAVRLLPPAVTDNLTFSTYEPYHRNIRDFKLVDVVGTYLGAPEKGLDADLGTTRGFALDTIVPGRSSRELREPVTSLPTGVSDLMELAARGEWALLPAVRHAIGADASGLSRAAKALVRARGLARVDAGEADINALLVLQGDSLAAEELKQRSERVWPLVKTAALDATRTDVREAFRALLAEDEHITELWDEAFDAILREDFRTWESRWTVLREVAPVKVKQLLEKILNKEKNETKLARLPTDVRARLRTACGDVGLLPPRPLLVPIGLGELEPLLTSQPDWAGYTAFVLMAEDERNWLPHIPAPNRQQMRKRARDYLFNAPSEALVAYVHAARPFLDTDPSFLATLFTPYSVPATKLMDKLLASTTLEPGDWMKLCTTVGLTQDKWGEYLLEKDRLARLLVGLGGDEIAKDIWAGYLDLLTRALVAPELSDAEGDDATAIHDWEQKVHTHLKNAAERLTAAQVKLAVALPPNGVAKLFAANNLTKWVSNPASAERDGAEEVKLACERFGIDPVNLVEVAYRKGEYDQYDPASDAEALAPLLTLFRTCFPVDHGQHTARRALREAVRFSQVCPPQKRAALQVRLIRECIWDGHYRALLNSDERHTLQPATVTWLSGQVNAPKKATTKPGANPVAELEGTPVEVESATDEGDGELPDDEQVSTSKAKRKPAKKTKGSYKSARRQSGGNTWIWIVAGLALVTALIAGAIYMTRKKDPPAESPPAETKPAPKKVDPKQDKK